MRYIVCDDCGGYYKLQEDESLDDFDTCQCGGKLRPANSIREIIGSRDASTILCLHCGAKNKETNLSCYKCGEKLDIKPRIHDYPVKTLKSKSGNNLNLLDKISFMGLFAGIAFLVLSLIIGSLGVVGSLASSNESNLLRAFGGYLIILIFAIIASGFIASYISGTKEYVDGLLNGGLVGLTVSVIMALLIGLLAMTLSFISGIIAGMIILIFYGLIFGSFTAFGGLVAVWFRNTMEDS